MERLVLDLKIGHGTNYLKRMIHRAARQERPFDIQPSFEALTVFVCLLNQSNKEKHSTDFFASLLKLPTILQISGGFKSKRNDFLAQVRYSNENPVKIDSSSSSLTSLDVAAYAVSRKTWVRCSKLPKLLRLYYGLPARQM